MATNTEWEDGSIEALHWARQNKLCFQITGSLPKYALDNYVSFSELYPLHMETGTGDLATQLGHINSWTLHVRRNLIEGKEYLGIYIKLSKFEVPPQCEGLDLCEKVGISAGIFHCSQERRFHKTVAKVELRESEFHGFEDLLTLRELITPYPSGTFNSYFDILKDGSTIRFWCNIIYLEGGKTPESVTPPTQSPNFVHPEIAVDTRADSVEPPSSNSSTSGSTYTAPSEMCESTPSSSPEDTEKVEEDEEIVISDDNGENGAQGNLPDPEKSMDDQE